MSDARELIRNAALAIGQGDSDEDWKVAPTAHAEQFADKAPSLADNLLDSRPQGLAEMFEDQDAEAVRSRDKFKATVGKANFAIFLTASFGALLLVASGLQGQLGESGELVIRTVGVIGIVCSLLATMWLSQIKGGKLDEKWASDRARAEAKRLTYFKAILEGASDEPQDRLLALEYTRRFLLDNQIDYFKERGRQHESASGSALNLSTAAVFVASLMTATAGFLAFAGPHLAAIAGLGVIATAFATLIASQSVVNLDRNNADRYRTAADHLMERKLHLDDYRKRIAAGDVGALQEYFDPVFVVLQADHKAFLSDSEQRELAIGGMEKRLDAAKGPLKKPPPENAGGP